MIVIGVLHQYHVMIQFPTEILFERIIKVDVSQKLEYRLQILFSTNTSSHMIQLKETLNNNNYYEYNCHHIF